MAATTRGSSTEPFPPLDSGPRTPTSQYKRPVTNETALSPKSNPLGLSPVTLTGVAAMAEMKKRKQQSTIDEARETSPNPPMQALQTLMGGGGMSKPSDAPAPDKLSEPLQKAAQSMHVQDNGNGDHLQVSPTSMTSFGTMETSGSTAMTATAHDESTMGQQFTDEPAQMTEPATYQDHNGNLNVASDPDGPKAFSYPGPPPEQSQSAAASRGMSYPGIQGSPKSSPSNKRHKCPYCETDFTRHHNLKSHLLTHSQEKPYECRTCQARFRRLHDLKRHTKLHTGERPHTCDKCGRRFARGDALARHNKGPGGCAGRRSSFGGEDDEFGEDGEGMDGVEYDGEGSPPDQGGRRVSEPSRKRTHLETPEDPRRQIYRQGSSTYPPPQQQPNRVHASSVGSMGPPQVILQGSHTATSPREMTNPSGPYFGTPGQVFSQQPGMIESPKPLSPGQPMNTNQHRLSVGDASMSSVQNRNRSPSLSTQMQQAHVSSMSGGRTPPQPQPQFPSHHGSTVLPPLAAQTQARTGFHPTSQPGHGPSMLHHQQVPPVSAGSNPGSLSSHGRSSGSSLRDAMQEPNDLWAYVRNIEARFSRMQDEYELRISRLQEDVISLKQQVSNVNSYSSDMGRAQY